MTSFRSGLAIGVLATAVIALAVTVVILVVSADDESASGVDDEACVTVLPNDGEHTGLEAAYEGFDCAEAKNVVQTWLNGDQPVVGSGAALTVGAWNCVTTTAAEQANAQDAGEEVVMGKCESSAGLFQLVRTEEDESGPAASSERLPTEAPQPEIDRTALQAGRVVWDTYTPETKAALAQLYLDEHPGECPDGTTGTAAAAFLDANWDNPGPPSPGGIVLGAPNADKAMFLYCDWLTTGGDV